jgi:protease-4
VRRPVALLPLLACVALQGCAVVLADLDPFDDEPEALQEHVLMGEGEPKVLLIDVSRTITADEQEGVLGLRRRESTVARVAQILEQAKEDEDVRALVLRINSPGGTVGASDVIHHQIRAFAETKKVPVVAQFLDVGASGAYYVALAADEIVAQPTTVTGSIGVILFGLDAHGLLDKIGVRDETLTAGANKDLGSPLRPLRPEERAILQGILDSMHGRFVALVRERRPNVSEQNLSVATDGRIFTADQALALGLVDRIGYLDDAIAAAKRRAGVADATVVSYTRPSELAENIYSSATIPAPQVNLVNFDFGALVHDEARFMYLWRPALFGGS